jgi:hypothetical protein
MFSLSFIRRINDLGAQQLQVDANALKDLLLDLPKIGISDEEQVRKEKERLFSLFCFFHVSCFFNF